MPDSLAELPHIAAHNVSNRLVDRVNALCSGPRPELVTGIKALRQAEWDRIYQAYLERINEMTGTDIALRLTAVVDSIIIGLVQRAMTRAEAPADWHEHVAVVALGGYGRCEFNPRSDLDLLLLIRGRSEPDWAVEANTQLQTLFWDCGFQVGASMRRMGELEQIIRDDFVTATALIEQRVLVGGDRVSEELEQLLQRFRKSRAKAFLRYKVDELEHRREGAGVSILRMEPNLKSGPGGLRDVQFLMNAGYMVDGSRNFHALRSFETIGWNEVHGIASANDHLLGLRSLNHFHHGRRQDVFELSDQVRMAEQLGYGGSASLRAVEQLMRMHYQKALLVDQLCRLSESRLRDLGYLGLKLPLIRTRRRLNNHFVIIDKRIYCSDTDLWRRDDLTLQLLKAFRSAQKRKIRVSYELQRSIKANADLVGKEARTDPRCAEVFREICAETGATNQTLTDMHRSGLLGAYLPEFGHIDCHMQFNAYHHYTVDEHTLIAIRHMDEIANGADGVPRHLSELYQTLPAKDLLTIGLLMHDVGKYMGRGHVERGALMVGPVAARLGLDEAEEELLLFLVRFHTSLSDASRQRDFSDPDFLTDYTRKMGSTQRLDYLYCLTWADAKAVGPGVLAGWQEATLEECWRTVRSALQGEHQAKPRRLRLTNALVTAGISEDKAQAFLDVMPQTYRYQASPVDIANHFRCLESAQGDADRFAMKPGPANGQLSMVAVFPDRALLLADVASVTAGHGLDVFGCRVWVTGSGEAVMSLHLNACNPGKWSNTEAWQRLEKDLRTVAQGHLDTAPFIERRRGMISAEKRPDSGFDDIEVRIEEITTAATVLDIKARDSVGLLARLCGCIADRECRIDFASVNTMGEAAVDVFYITRDGQRLGPEEAADLRRAVERSVEVESKLTKGS